MAGLLSKGVKLSYDAEGGSDFTELTDLQEVPELGGESESVEVTTLADAAHTYIPGILNYGDSLGFKFLYSKAQFTTLQGLAGKTPAWKVELPDGASCTFKGGCSVKMDAIAVNGALTYTLGIKPNSAMVWA